MALTSSTLCKHCVNSQRMGHARCFWCGCTFAIGRAPTEEERLATSRRAPIDLPPEPAPRTPAQLDEKVSEFIRKKLQPLAEFTQDQLAEMTGLTVCACKHSLDRLAQRRVIAAVGQVKIKWQRYRTVWQVLVQHEDVAPKSNPEKSNRVAATSSDLAHVS